MLALFSLLRPKKPGNSIQRGLSLLVVVSAFGLDALKTGFAGPIESARSQGNTPISKNSWKFSVEQTPLSLGGGGYITGLWGDGGTRVIATTDNAGVFVSTDGGSSWKSRNKGFNHHESEAVRSILHPRTPGGALLAAVGNRGAGVENISGIFRWSSAALSWQAWAGKWTGLEEGLLTQEPRLSFDGAFNPATHTRPAFCHGAPEYRAVASGQVLLEASALCPGSEQKAIYAATLSDGILRNCGETWESLHSVAGMEFTSLIEVTPHVLLAGSLPPVGDSNGCALTAIDLRRGAPVFTCLAPASLVEVRDLALDAKNQLWVAGGVSGIWKLQLSDDGFRLTVTKKSHLIDSAKVADCSVSPDRSGIFTSIDLSRNGWIATSHLGGAVFFYRDEGRTWTSIDRNRKKRLHTAGFKSISSETAITVDDGLAAGLYGYTPNFLASVSSVHWIHNSVRGQEAPSSLLASDYFSVWQLAPDGNAARRSALGIENTVSRDIAVNPDGTRALLAKFDAPLLMQNSMSSALAVPLTPGTAGNPAAAGDCFLDGQIRSVESLLWPTRDEGFLLARLDAGYRLCAINESGFQLLEHTGLPSLSAIQSLGHDESNPNVLYIARECSLHRGVRERRSSRHWNWTEVYAAGSMSGAACRSMGAAGRVLSGVDDTPFARVVRVGSSTLGAAQLGDRVVISRDGGLTWINWNQGLFGLARDDVPIGHAPGAATNLRLTAMAIRADGDHLDVWVGTGAFCRTYRTYASGTGCVDADLDGGLYRRPLFPTPNDRENAGFLNQIRFGDDANLILEGTRKSQMVFVRDIIVIDSDRIAFASDALGKNIASAAGYRPHVGGVFLSGDAGRTWTRISDPKTLGSTHFSSLGASSDGTALWVGSRSNGFGRFRILWTQRP